LYLTSPFGRTFGSNETGPEPAPQDVVLTSQPNHNSDEDYDDEKDSIRSFVSFQFCLVPSAIRDGSTGTSCGGSGYHPKGHPGHVGGER
jgi:hypothetical protein